MHVEFRVTNITSVFEPVKAVNENKKILEALMATLKMKLSEEILSRILKFQERSWLHHYHQIQVNFTSIMMF